jgi:transposase
MEGYNLVMDNASIHHSKELKETFSKRSYHCAYLPPYSPFLPLSKNVEANQKHLSAEIASKMAKWYPIE